jgi:hypothetical protein
LPLAHEIFLKERFHDEVYGESARTENRYLRSDGNDLDRARYAYNRLPHHETFNKNMSVGGADQLLSLIAVPIVGVALA